MYTAIEIPPAAFFRHATSTVSGRVILMTRQASTCAAHEATARILVRRRKGSSMSCSDAERRHASARDAIDYWLVISRCTTGVNYARLIIRILYFHQLSFISGFKITLPKRSIKRCHYTQAFGLNIIHASLRIYIYYYINRPRDAATRALRRRPCRPGGRYRPRRDARLGRHRSPWAERQGRRLRAR